MRLSTGVDHLNNLEYEIQNIFINRFKPKGWVPAAGSATKNVLSVMFRLIK